MVRTVWSRGALDHIPERFRALARVVYPLIYGAFVVGFGAWGGTHAGGSAAVQRVSIAGYPWLLCLLIGVSGLVAFVGLVFGQKPLELVGQIGLILFILMYLILLFLALGLGAGAPIAAATTTTIIVILLGYKAYDTMNEIASEKAARDQLG